MDNLTGFYALNNIHQRREQRNVVLHSVPLDVDNHDSERNLFEIVLVFKTLIDGDQNITPILSLGDQLGIRESTPLGFSDS